MIRTLLLTALLLDSPAAADTLTAAPDLVKVGEPVRLALAIDLAPGETADIAKAITLPKGIEAASFRPLGTERYEWVLLPYATGDVAIGPVAYRVTAADGSVAIRTAGPATFTVASVLKDGDTDLAPMKPQADLPLRWSRFIPLALVALALVLLAAWIARRLRNRPVAPLPPPPVSESDPADVVALRSLAALPPFDPSRPRATFNALSEIVRRYLAGRYGLRAEEMTTGEIRARFDARHAREAQRLQLERLLTDCDVARFAREVPEGGEADRLQGEAVRFVESTRPPRTEPPVS